MDVFIDKINVFFGMVASMLAMLFGDFWMFFLAFFIFNIVDYATGLLKAKHMKTESSGKGAKGIVKKVGYWVIISISFFVSVSCIEFGMLVGMDLMFLSFIGYFTLATYIINEIRSIIENLVVLGVDIPPFLTKGLAIADKLITDKANAKTGDVDTDKK